MTNIDYSFDFTSKPKLEQRTNIAINAKSKWVKSILGINTISTEFSDNTQGSAFTIVSD